MRYERSWPKEARLGMGLLATERVKGCECPLYEAQTPERRQRQNPPLAAGQVDASMAATSQHRPFSVSSSTRVRPAHTVGLAPQIARKRPFARPSGATSWRATTDECGGCTGYWIGRRIPRRSPHGTLERRTHCPRLRGTEIFYLQSQSHQFATPGLAGLNSSPPHDATQPTSA